MSHSVPLLDFSYLSSGDMSSNQYKAVQLSTTNAADGVIVVATRGGTVDGVFQDNSTVSEAGQVALAGISKVLAGDSSAMETAISPGTRLVASSVGHAVPSTAVAQSLIGIAQEALSTGSTGIIAVLLTIGAVSSS